MIRLICGLVSIFLMTAVVGQDRLEIRIEPEVKTDDGPACFSVDIRNTDMNVLKLASMNYRIFYNSDNLKLIKDGIHLKLPERYYTMKLVQDLREVDATWTGPLPFEGNLGFLNYSVIFQDGSDGSIRLTKSEPWLTVTELCFEVRDDRAMQSIVLARNEVTAQYGKAFVELSAYDKDDQITATVISSYKDYNLRPPKHSN